MHTHTHTHTYLNPNIFQNKSYMSIVKVKKYFQLYKHIKYIQKKLACIQIYLKNLASKLIIICTLKTIVVALVSQPIVSREKIILVQNLSSTIY